MRTKASDYAKIFRAAAAGWYEGNARRSDDMSYIRCTNKAFLAIAEVFENIAKAEGESI